MVFRSKKKCRRLVVIGIDGVPYSFIKQQTNNGNFPNLAEIFQEGMLRRIHSVYPTVSSVAWSSYMTGKNPGEHGIFGFVDRMPNPFDIFIPTAKNMKAEPLWEILGRRGKKVVVINVPVTYPPRRVNGILIGGFLGTDINKISYPSSANEKLKAMNYRIDVDAWKGREKDKTEFLQDLNFTLDKRMEVAKNFMETEDWDFFQLHIMETDRINHFLWEHWETGDQQYQPEFLKFYQKLDFHIGEMWRSIVKDSMTHGFILSDHGFCTVKKEVYVNHWLREKGYLKFENKEPKNVKEMNPETVAYSLIPGRIFINLRGREERGSVEINEYESLRYEISEQLLNMVDSDSGEKIIQKVLKREEIYSGSYLEQAADLIAIPYDGYDLKGNVNSGKLTHKGELVGMHTYDDAALFVPSDDIEKNEDVNRIEEVGKSVLTYFGLTEL